MGDILDALQPHRLVGVDSAIFIYHIEQLSPWARVAGRALNGLERGTFSGITSVLTLLEIIVKPLQAGRPEAADDYQALLESIENLSTAEIDVSVSRLAAGLRARYRLRTPDALQMAACLSGGATAFLTNDRGLRRVKELDVYLLEDFL